MEQISLDNVAKTTRPAEPWFTARLWPTPGQDPVICPTPEAMAKGLSSPQARALLIYLPPMRALSEYGAGPESEPKALVSDWSKAARDWHDVLRAYRAKITLICRPETVAQRLDLLAALGDLPAPAVLGAQGDDPAPRALGGLALRHDPTAFDMVQTLQATTTGPYTPIPSVADLIAALARQAGEAQALAGQLSELETLLQERITAQTSAEARLEENDRMSALLLDQIATLQDAVRSLASHRPAPQPARQPDKQPVQNSKELEALRTELAAVYASNSWKITAPIRAVIRRLRG